MSTQLDSSDRGRARIGVLVPFTNVNLEPDMARMAPEGVSMHFSRLGGYDADAIPDADQMAGLGASAIDEPLRLLAGVRPDVVLYGCTSATLTLGTGFDRALSASIRRTSGCPTVTAAGALAFALKQLNVKRIGFASPYVGEINRLAVEFLNDCHFQTVSRAEVSKALDNYGQGQLTPDEVFALGLEADSDAAEAIVLSCTDMRSVDIINRLEQAIGKPVVSSNQAMLFEAMHVLSIDTAQHPFGLLFDVATHVDTEAV